MTTEESESRGLRGSTRKPFQFTARADFEEGVLQTKVAFEVPRRRLLVIENVSATLEVPIEQTITSTQIKTVVDDVRAWHAIPVYRTGTFGDRLGIYCGGQQVRLYADPGSSVTVLVRRNEASCPDGSCGTTLVCISGYLLPAGSPSLAP